MLTKRVCKAIRGDGAPCGMPPLRERSFCLAHDPDHVEEAQEARRLGGQRRRRERIVAEVYDFEGLDSIPKIRRVVEIAVLDTFGLENSVNRNRTLIAGAQTAAKLLETGELEDRVADLEEVMGPRLKEKRR
jgi:hypothetical protein